MQEDLFPAAEKILSDIENVIKKDVNLQSFEIIPSPDSENRSPVYHTENSLGLASWCVQPLYTYTYTRLMDLRHTKHRREEPSTISRWLMGALLLNPEVSTFWNMRRELLKNNRLDFLQELRFTKLVLFNKAKCFEAFSYRKWLLHHVLVDQPNPTVDVESILRSEISVSGTSADRYGSNYNAWSHREQMIATYEALCPSSLVSLLISEWETSGKWCSCHVSDHSGLAYRQFLLRKLILLEKSSRNAVVPEELEKRREIVMSYVRGLDENTLTQNSSLEEVLEALHGTPEQKTADLNQDRVLMALSYWVEDAVLNQELINSFPGHEALWYHRRFLAFILKAITRSYAKVSGYKGEFFEPREAIRIGKCGETLLEKAFDIRNQEIIAVARKLDCEMNIVDKFVKFVAGLKLDG